MRSRFAKANENNLTVSRETRGVARWLHSFIKGFERSPSPLSERVLSACCKIIGIEEPPPLAPEVPPPGLRYLPKRPPTPTKKEDDT